MNAEKIKDTPFQSPSRADDSAAHPGCKAPWTAPTLTRLPGEETEIQPSFGIVKLLLAGS